MKVLLVKVLPPESIQRTLCWVTQFATPLARGQQVYCSPIFQNAYLNSAPNVDHSVYMGFLVDKVILG